MGTVSPQAQQRWPRTGPGRAGRMHHRMHHPPGAGQVRTGRQGGPRGLAWLFPVLDCGRWSCDCVPRPLSDKQEEDGGGSRLQVQKEERRLVCREIGPFWCLTNAAWSCASCPSAREASVGGGASGLIAFVSHTMCTPPSLWAGECSPTLSGELLRSWSCFFCFSRICGSQSPICSFFFQRTARE